MANKTKDEQIKHLQRLLEPTACPICDGSGRVYHYFTVWEKDEQDYEVVDCQWCYEREQALKEFRHGGS